MTFITVKAIWSVLGTCFSDGLDAIRTKLTIVMSMQRFTSSAMT